MQDIDKISWIEQLEVTGPIKSIMGFVDELSQNYDKRVAAMHADYQKDIEEILVCYKHEKQEFQTILDQQKITIAELQVEIKNLQQNYKTLSVEYKMNQERLETSKLEIMELSKALRNEEELVALAKERIQAANAQLKVELEQSEQTIATEDLVFDESLPIQPKRARFQKTKEFLQQIFADRKQRPILLKTTETKNVIDENDTFSY